MKRGILEEFRKKEKKTGLVNPQSSRENVLTVKVLPSMGMHAMKETTRDQIHENSIPKRDWNPKIRY